LIIAALAVIAFLSGSGLVRLAGVGALVADYDPDNRVQQLADPILAVIAFVVLLLSLLLLTVLGVLALRLIRHRLSPDLPPTCEMTKSIGIDLANRRSRMPIVSPAGFAINLGVVVLVGALILSFPEWIGQSLVVGSFSLVVLLIWSVFLPMLMIYRAVAGDSLVQYGDLSNSGSASIQSGRLLVLAATIVSIRAIWRVGRRFNLRRRDQITLKDKPPVLLLRSFRRRYRRDTVKCADAPPILAPEAA
jgi:hypothetical protein